MSKFPNIILSLVSFLTLFTYVADAQVTTENTQRFRMYADEEGKPERFDHLFLTIKHDRWLTNEPNFDIKPYGIGMDIGFLKDFPLNKTGSTSIAIGFEYSLTNIHHNQNVGWSLDSGSGKYNTLLSPIADSYKKNKFTTHGFNVPIEFRFRKIKDPKFRLYPGFKGGWLSGNFATHVANDGSKNKVYRIKNVLPFTYGPTLRIGYGKVILTGYYGISSVFKEGLGPKINQVSFGLTFFSL